MPEGRYKVISIVLIAITVTFALALVSMSTPTKADTTSAPPRTLTVSGSGTVTGMPDTYTVSFSVTGADKDPGVAMQNATDLYDAVMANLEKSGYNTSLLTLDTLNVYPEYYYPSNGPAVFQDYSVVYALQYEETVANPTASSLGVRAAGVIVAAVEAGVGNVNSVSFSLSDAGASALKSQALSKAVADAKGKAETLSQGLGVQLVEVQSTQVTDSYTPPVYSQTYDLYTATLSGISTPAFNAGPATENIQVGVVYIIG